MLVGKNVTLQSIDEKDLETLRSWRNTPALRKYFREYTELSQFDQLNWYKNVVLQKKSTLMFSILEKLSQNLLGACGLCYIDWFRKSADLSIYIGHELLYLDDIYAPQSAQLLIQYGFKELGLHRIWAEVYSHDIKKQGFFKDLGFTCDGRLRQSHWHDGAWIDSLYFSLLSTDSKIEVIKSV